MTAVIRRLREALRLLDVIAGCGFRAAPGLMLAATVTRVVGAIASASYPLGYRLVVDGATHGDGAWIATGAGLVAAMAGLAWVLGMVSAGQGSVLTDRVNLSLGERIARLVTAIPGLEHLERPDHLREIDQLREDRRTLAGAPRQLLALAQAGIRGVVVVALLASVFPPVLAVVLVGLAPMLADRRAGRLRKRADDDLAEGRRLQGELFTLATTAGAAGELRTYGIAEALAERHRRLGETIRARATRAALRSAAGAALGWLLYAAGFVAVIVVLVARAVHGDATAGQVVMAVSLVRRAQRQVSSASETAATLGVAVRTARRLLWLEDYAARSLRGSGVRRPAPDRLREGIRLERVTFAYPGGEAPVLRDVDLHLRAGTTVAVVGENGAGKTTLVKLLTGMYPPTAGRVLVDGVDLAEMDLAAWRERTSATFQDFVRFQLTARETVGAGDLARLEDEPAVLTAVERAGASELVAGLARGLDTQLGRWFTGGRELSGGQWQRLALARGLMRPGALLTVLDEPTASLDALSEGALFERYAGAARRAGGGITLFVSHRFSTVRVADVIVVLEGGRVVEVGSHDELMGRSGLYAQLFTLQARAYADRAT
jgi:ATP-binding cassette subfamily B protein